MGEKNEQNFEFLLKPAIIAAMHEKGKFRVLAKIVHRESLGLKHYRIKNVMIE